MAAPGAVNLYRDRWGTAHLYAEREEDGFFGLGYAVGEDRLEGVLAAYLAVRGELAATFGPGPVRAGLSALAPTVLASAVEADRSALRGRYLEAARRNFPKLSAQTRANLRAYIAGLDRYVEENPARVPEWAPPLEPALPVAFYAMLLHVEGQHACDRRIPGDARSGRDTRGGSNAWALAPARTVSGATIFGADSHSEIELFGTFFYPWRMKAGDLDVFSVDLTGTVSMMKGHSRYFAWAWTEGRRFIADCYAVRTIPGDPRRYRYDGRTLQMEVRDYAIGVKGGETIVGELEYTRHNGVLSPVVARRGDVAYVSSGAYAGRAGYAYDQLRALATANSRATLEDALSGQDLYPANLLIGGADGTILYIQPGRIPVRFDGWQADRPLDGNTGETAWSGFHPYTGKVKLVNPPEGYITNENVSPDMMYPHPRLSAADYPPWFGFVPGQTNSRQRRAMQVLSAGRPVTLERAKAILFDDFLMGSTRWNAPLAALARSLPKDSALHDFIATAAGFDGHFAPESRAALYHAEIREAVRTSGQAAADALIDAVNREQPLSDEEGAVLRGAARAGMRRLKEAFGRVDLVFGDVYVTGRGGVAAPGLGFSMAGAGSSLVANGSVPGPDGRRHHVAGTRHPFLVEFARPLRSWSLTLPGVSDRPGSSHYTDQAPLLARRELKPNYFHAAELAAAMESVRTLDTGSAGFHATGTDANDSR